MDISDLHAYCMGLAHVTEDQPFGPDVVTFRIAGKIFLLLALDVPLSFNVKCEPELAIELREQFEDVLPGYHMNKKHWNTVRLEGSLTNRQICDMVDHSYNLVFNALPARVRATLTETN